MEITVKQIADKLELKQWTQLPLDRPVDGGCVCDLLSWVMARGEEGMVWVTVHTHLNVLAVACLHDFACVIVPEGIAVPEATIEKAQEEGIPMLSYAGPAYELCGLLHDMGV